jgi:hypothetical protein
MQQLKDEAKFVPISYERGLGKLVQKARIGYSFPSHSTLTVGNANRHFLFIAVSKGYMGSSSYTHNAMRFRSTKMLIPNREKEQQFQAGQKAKNEEVRKAKIALKYGKKFKTATIGTIIRMRMAGIKVKHQARRLTFSNADVLRQITILLSSEMQSSD